MRLRRTYCKIAVTLPPITRPTFTYRYSIILVFNYLEIRCDRRFCIRDRIGPPDCLTQSFPMWHKRKPEKLE
jgi:hypothetical protein